MGEHIENKFEDDFSTEDIESLRADCDISTTEAITKLTSPPADPLRSIKSSESYINSLGISPQTFCQ